MTEILSSDEWPSWIKTYFDTVLSEREKHWKADYNFLHELLIQKDTAVRELIAQKEELVNSKFSSAEMAITKAEEAVKEKFRDANEWRSQSADRERTMQENRIRLEEKFVPREVNEKQIDDLRARLDNVYKRLDLTQGQETGSRITKASFYSTLVAAIAFVTVVIVILNFVTAHG